MFSTLEAHMTKKNTAHGIFGTCISLYLFLKDEFYFGKKSRVW